MLSAEFFTMIKIILSKVYIAFYIQTIVIFVIACLLIKFLLKKQISVSAIWAALISYLYMVLVLTVLSRQPGSESAMRLIPFWSWREAFNNKYILYEIIDNIILFIPIGLLLSVLLHERRVFRSIMFAFLYTLILELLQYIFEVGLFEFDDIIAAMIGTFIGLQIVNVFGIVLKKRTEL